MLVFLKQLRICSTLLGITIGVFPGFPSFVQAQWSAPSHLQKAGSLFRLPRLDTGVVLTPLAITLPPATRVEKSTVQNTGSSQPLQIGFGRDIPVTYQGDVSALLDWTSTRDGGLVASLQVTSPEALAMRLALAIPIDVPDAEIRFMSLADHSQVFGPFTATDFLTPAARISVTLPTQPETNATREPSWSPVIEGDTIAIEIYIPSPAALAVFSLQLLQVSHLVYSIHRSLPKRLSDIDRSGACNIDVKCQNTTPSNLEAATAKIIYTRDGGSFLCSGTLLNDNDSDTFIPYFLTANHCLSDTTTASTVNSFWFYERADCGSPNPTSVTQFVGGSEILATGQGTDFTLLQLNDSAISDLSNIWFAGWDNGPLPNPTAIIGIHHPLGDLKKWSAGSTTGFTPNPLLTVPPDPSSHIRLIWSLGTTEPGSSGSGLFDTNGNLRGTLSGGSASCGSPSDPDFYGRFDKTFPSVERWLSLVPAQLSSGSVLSDAVQQDQWREYKLTTKPSDFQLTVRLTGLNQDADLYVRRGSRPSVNQFDCRSFLSGASEETCTLTNAGSQVYYIGVTGFGLGTTPFTLQTTTSQGTLENPQPGSFQSGIGVISGFVCDATLVEIQFDGGAPFEAGYGTSRADTLEECGDTNNGFGLLFNWNLVGDGVHTVRAVADGVEFANVNITVTTLGLGEFPQGLSGMFTLPDFPQGGTQTQVQWQQSQQNFVIVSGNSSGNGDDGGDGQVLENPQPGSFQSGIGVISGFVCDATLVEIQFDGGAPFEAGYGTSRADTLEECGDTNNGFGLLFNWNLVGDGVHTVRAVADGVEFANVNITVTTLGLGEFPQGLSGMFTLPDFPQSGTQTQVQWQQSQQNFVIEDVQ